MASWELTPLLFSADVHRILWGAGVQCKPPVDDDVLVFWGLPSVCSGEVFQVCVDATFQTIGGSCQGVVCVGEVGEQVVFPGEFD